MKVFVKNFIFKNNLPGVVIGIIVFLVVIFLSCSFYIFEEFELKTLDLRFHFRGEKPPPSDIIIVAIDEKSISQFGRWPWKRKNHANLIKILKEEKAKIIFFDIFFLEKSDYPEDDQMLFSAVKEAGNVFFDYPLLSDKDIKTKEDKNLIPYLHKNSRKRSDFKEAYFIEEKSALFPLPEILFEAKGVGHATIYEDEDHLFRKTALWVKYQERVYPFISILLASEYYGVNLKDISITKDILEIGKTTVPLIFPTQMFINYRGGANTFPCISYCDVISKEFKKDSKKFKKDLFKNKIVLIGGTASGLFDIRPTPFGQMPGIEIIANSLSTLISGNFISPTSNFINFTLIFLFSLMSGYFTFRSGLLKITILVIATSFFYIIGCIYLFEKKGIFLNMLSPLGGMFLTYIITLIYRYLIIEREKKKIKNAFQHYVTSSVVAEILKNPDSLKLGGEKKILTVLFSDIRGFTELSEKLTPEEVVSILNEYFTEMTDIVFKYEGTLDKFIGDAIMVVYGAPVYFPDHAEKAVKTAIEMRDKMRELQLRWKKEGRVDFSIGIGINTGEMIVGNMGSRDRWDYTVVGDAVNLASRLEHQTRESRVDIIISEGTYNLVKDKIIVKELGEVMVRGKQKLVVIYEVVGKR